MTNCIAFTGHRPNKLDGYRDSAVQTWVRAQLRDCLKKIRPDIAITGMALGVDQWAAEECLALKIPFIAAVPFQGQESRWPPGARRRYFELLAQAARIECVSPPGYSAVKMQHQARRSL